MPGYNIRMQHGGIREGLRCFLCKLLLKDPVQASETGERYCTECFKETVRYATIKIRFTYLHDYIYACFYTLAM